MGDANALMAKESSTYARLSKDRIWTVNEETGERPKISIRGNRGGLTKGGSQCCTTSIVMRLKYINILERVRSKRKEGGRRKSFRVRGRGE